MEVIIKKRGTGWWWGGERGQERETKSGQVLTIVSEMIYLFLSFADECIFMKLIWDLRLAYLEPKGVSPFSN